MKIIEKAFSGVKWSSLGMTGSAFFQLLQISILARFITKEGFGLVAMALFIIQLTNIFVDMGLNIAILHRQNSTKSEYSSVYWLNIMFSLILYFFLVLSTGFISEFYSQPELNNIIPVLGLNILFISIGRQHRTIMQKEFQFRSIALIELTSYFIGLACAIILALNNFGIFSLIYSTLLASLISNLNFLIVNIKRNPINLKLNFSETKPFLKIGGYSMGSSIVDFFSREFDILIIGKFLGPESLGVYSLAKQIILKIFNIINPIIMNVMSPILSKIQNQKKLLKSSFLKLIRYVARVNVFIYSVVIFASTEILYFLYGTDYVDSASVLLFLSIAFCIISITSPVGSLQIATGRTDIGFKWTVFRLLLTTPVIYFSAFYSIEIVSLNFALLSIFLTIPLWYIQLKPMAGINIWEFVNNIYNPIIFLLIISFLSFEFVLSIKLTEYQFLDLLIKLFTITLIYIFHSLVIEKEIFFKMFNMFKSTIKS